MHFFIVEEICEQILILADLHLTAFKIKLQDVEERSILVKFMLHL